MRISMVTLQVVECRLCESALSLMVGPAACFDESCARGWQEIYLSSVRLDVCERHLYIPLDVLGTMCFQ